MNRLKKIGNFFCSMQFALILLALLIIACVAGSFISQDELESYYTSNYPEKVGWIILLLGLDDVFHSWWFIAITAFLCLNLLGCNLLRFPIIYKSMHENYTAQNCVKYWNDNAVSTINAETPDKLFKNLGFNKLEYNEHNGTKYCYSVHHKVGLWGAWLTHLGIFIIIIGFSLGQIFTVKYTVYGVPGQTKAVEDTKYNLTIDDFNISLRDDETVEQYTAYVTLTDTETNESQSGETSVNNPVKLFGMQVYQNSTGWAADVSVYENDELLQSEVLCAGEYLEVSDKQGLYVVFTAFYPDYVAGSDGMPSTASSNLNNPAYLYTVYYNNKVIGMNVLTDGDYISIDDYIVKFENPKQYTLIQLKRDPFTWIALIGGIVILLALFLAFYVRIEEIWAIQIDNNKWNIYGRSPKGGILFNDNIIEQIKKLN